MPDLRFFSRSGPFSLSDLADRVGAEIVLNGGSPDLLLEDVAPLDSAGASHLSFLDNPKYREALTRSQAGACLMRPEHRGLAPAGMVLFLTTDPHKAYARAAQTVYPDPELVPFISPDARIDPSARVAPGCRIESGVQIGAGAVVGEGSSIGPYTVIGVGVEIGPRALIGAHVTISHALIGAKVRISPGARIGQEGFGFAIDPAGFVRVPQLGRVIIEDGVRIGANCTIDRGAVKDTVIGAGTWIDNLVHIAHNVQVGRGCILVAQVGVAGSTVIEDFVALGGQVGIAGHLRIGKGAQIAAQSGVIRDVPPGEVQMGYPALPMTQFMRHVSYLNRAIRKKV